MIGIIGILLLEVPQPSRKAGNNEKEEENPTHPQKKQENAENKSNIQETKQSELECNSFKQGFCSCPFWLLFFISFTIGCNFFLNFPYLILIIVFTLFFSNYYKTYGLNHKLDDEFLTLAGSIGYLINSLGRPIFFFLYDKLGFKITYYIILILYVLLLWLILLVS